MRFRALLVDSFGDLHIQNDRDAARFPPCLHAKGLPHREKSRTSCKPLNRIWPRASLSVQHVVPIDYSTNVLRLCAHDEVAQHPSTPDTAVRAGAVDMPRLSSATGTAASERVCDQDECERKTRWEPGEE